MKVEKRNEDKTQRYGGGKPQTRKSMQKRGGSKERKGQIWASRVGDTHDTQKGGWSRLGIVQIKEYVQKVRRNPELDESEKKSGINLKKTVDTRGDRKKREKREIKKEHLKEGTRCLLKRRDLTRYGKDRCWKKR